MKPNQFLILCLSGIFPVTLSIFRTVPHNYELVMTPMSWLSAQYYCRMKYTDLAIILSDTDKLRLKKEAASKGLATAAWVGVYKDLSSFIWSLNNLPLSNVPYSNWCLGEPNNDGGIEACVIISTNSKWFDVPCSILKPFICYNAKFSGAARFIGISSPTKTWFDAQTYCQTYHTDLASALNSSDNDMLGVVNARQGDSWIGLRRDTWMWSDGTFASGLSWAIGQPGNYGGIKRCAALENGLYYDSDCNLLLYFFCDTNFPTRRQTVELQVKSDGSVFDPAVQSSILEQIKQKLKENGMLENTTVTWAVQPDGNIFHKKKKNDP